jgi:drug/metabolite transporter (DMT)-like permease
MAGLMWAAARLEPARVGILLMAEVLVGVVSAALIAGEALGTLEILGGLLVLSAGVLEVWPVRSAADARG